MTAKVKQEQPFGPLAEGEPLESTTAGYEALSEVVREFEALSEGIEVMYRKALEELDLEPEARLREAATG